MSKTGLGSFLRRQSADDDSFRARLKHVPPTVLGEVRFRTGPCWGEVVGISILADEMGGSRARAGVGEAVETALKRGSRVVGLGGLTSPATGSGLRLVSKLPSGAVLTNGNAYTAAVVARNVQAAAKELGGTRPVAVVGCTGSVGAALSALLADAGFRLLLVGRTRSRVERLLGGLAIQAEFAGDLDKVSRCGIVVLLTNSPEARPESTSFDPETIVIDCAQPPALNPKHRNELQERGVVVVDGGLVDIPGYSTGFDFGLEDRTASFACLAETYLFACEGLRDHSVGRPSMDTAKRLERIARRRGLLPRPLSLDGLKRPQTALT